MARSLYWFRSDLRIEDNWALAEAMRHSEAVIAVFILTPETWKSHFSALCKIQFLLANLKSLSAALWKQGIPLLIRSGPTFSDAPQVLEALCDEFKLDSIYFNREYPLDERVRDRAVCDLLGSKVSIKTFHQYLVFAPGEVLSQQGKPFQVFTPFKNVWLAKAQDQQSWRVSVNLDKKFNSDVNPDAVPDQLPDFRFDAKSKLRSLWEPGEAGARKKLMAFCENTLKDYHKTRDFPGIDGTSQLSPYLAQGVMSPRQCITAAFEAFHISNIHAMNNEGVATWVSELIWRDFYHHIVCYHPNICRYKPFKPKTDEIPWRHDDVLLEAWKAGMTGFPIVDAGMRQLLQTGWMHNRLRMVTAMFFSKILLLDWRLGERHFMEHLMDGDFAANNGGWQWCASTGTDAVPYFRIFNPTTQSQRFDPEGDFIRQFCPELSELDAKTIHNPFGFGEQNKGLQYPQPIVDYKLMRQKTIALFKNL